MKNQSFDSLNRYIFNSYDTTPPFTSFLPGIAGPLGIPLWIFYINRGQAVTSFGVDSKNSPIMEFQPANKAYQNTSFTGFRTWLKIRRGELVRNYEPFFPWSLSNASRQMFIGMNELELQENNPENGLQTNVIYFTIPGEGYAGLARILTLTNTGTRSVDLEVLDGMPALIPYGVNNILLKEMSRTAEAWMEVFNLDQGPPFYRVRASLEDKPEVETFEAGNFAVAFSSQQPSRLLKAIVDPNIVFGQNTSLSTPDRFYHSSLGEISQTRQIVCGKTPCAFFGAAAHLQPGENFSIYSIFGHMHAVDALNQQYRDWLHQEYFSSRRSKANQLTADLTDVIATHTSSPLLDGYCRQTFLDNVLRGGWPVLLGSEKTPYHIYSRKHGDPERDYNFFTLAPEFYSQGNGNYRDVNQNRRCDVFFIPELGDFNVRTFISLIQLDGYNPLVVRGSQFYLSPENRASLLALASPPEPLARLFLRPFTPGEMLKAIADHQISLAIPSQEYLARAVQTAEQHFVADHGEGFWTDHWTYNLDLIESYLAVYPERKAALLFDARTLTFYDSPAAVNPRHFRYCLTPQGPRQLNAVWEAPDKAALIASRESNPHLLRTRHGHGEVYRTTLFAKLFILALVKFATLDPWGMGVEMEAGKPGWYDAMNGLPGIFGASMPETYELKRLMAFLQQALLQAVTQQGALELPLPIEVCQLLADTGAHLEVYNASEDPGRDYTYWDAVSTAREAYRQATRLGLDGAEQVLSAAVLSGHLEAFLKKVDAGIQRALEINQGLPPTYFYYQVEDYETIEAVDSVQAAASGMVNFKAKSFKPVVMPLFLEGMVRAIKVLPQEHAAALFQKVRASDLYDRKLRMYKVNASLEDQPHHIGRARAFTPGWLENESIWLHMEYKYLLEVLRAGLVEEFFEDFKNALVPFQDPNIYRRSPLENSSFLVSSAHPDDGMHGAGFVSRLSGSTAEFLSIWQLMMVGEQPFILEKNSLCLKLAPNLPGWLFNDDGKITFNFLGCCKVIYHNPSRLDLRTGGPQPGKFILHQEGRAPKEIFGSQLPPPYAEALRSGNIGRMDVFFEA